MTKYFYARQSRIIANKKTGEKELQLLVPVIINPDTIEANNQHITPVCIGCRTFFCEYIWIPATYYQNHKRDLETQAKRDERSDRCLVSDPKKKGVRIRCPEENRCISCQKTGRFDFDNGHDASIDAMIDTFFDSESGIEFQSQFDAVSSMLPPEDSIVSRDEMKCLIESLDIIERLLKEHKPKYGNIFKELRKGETNASEIARRHGLNPNRTAEDVPKVQAMAKKLYDQLK